MKDQEEIIKHFIKSMSNELGDMNETIVRVSSDAYQKELALARKMKVHLVQAFNLIVQLEKAIDEPEGVCNIKGNLDTNMSDQEEWDMLEEERVIEADKEKLRMTSEKGS